MHECIFQVRLSTTLYKHVKHIYAWAGSRWTRFPLWYLPTPAKAKPGDSEAEGISQEQNCVPAKQKTLPELQLLP